MLDDDIQYIGTRPAQRNCLTLPNRPFPSPQRQVTGIALHIEKSGADPAYGMVFRRNNTSVIHIGRRPGSDSERRQRDSESGRAMFRCAVVSRKHAKIAFSDTGHVYLIDTGSHHGTHVRSTDETVSRMLKAETPAMLTDGDTITFGKSVGKNNEFVRPVVARVELLYGGQSDMPSSTTTFKPLVVPTNTTAPPDRPNPPTPRSSSGRYGVYVPSSSSSSSAMSSPIVSDHDSDIEEVSGPLPMVNTSSNDSINPGSPIGRAFEVLKRLLPPIHTPIEPPRDRSPPRGYYPHSPSPEYYPRSSSPFSPRASLAPFLDFASSSPLINTIDLDEYSPVGFDAYSNDVFEVESSGRSRSTSPMDLSSPSPPPSLHTPPDPPPAEPVVIGAWPASRLSSPTRGEVFSTPSIQHFDLPTVIAESTVQSPASNEAVASDSRRVSEAPALAEDVPIETAPVPEPSPSSETSEPTDAKGQNDEVAELKTTLENVRNELNKLQVHRRKYKSRFNANVHTIAEKLTDLDDRVSDVNVMYTSLADQLENATHVDIPELQAQVESLQEQADAVAPAFRESALTEALAGREDVKASVAALHQLVTEMRTLRENTEKQMAIELEAVKAARADALVAIEAQAQPPVLMSLKRKRSDDDDEGEAKDKSMSVDVAVGVGEGADVAVQATMIPTPPTTPTTMTNTEGIEVPSPKRAKRIMTTVVQTATCVTFGAVATWSALAFS